MILMMALAIDTGIKEAGNISQGARVCAQQRVHLVTPPMANGTALATDPGGLVWEEGIISLTVATT